MTKTAQEKNGKEIHKQKKVDKTKKLQTLILVRSDITRQYFRNKHATKETSLYEV